MRKFFIAATIATLAIGGSTACATKKFVRTSVGEVNDKVDSLGKSVEETQERTRKNEGRINDVDQKAGQAAQAAQQANAAAAEANNAAKQKIDEMVAQLKQDPKNVFIEIEGHTDNVGSPAINEKIGLERAQAVERYLYEQYQVPLHKMSVISYGEEKPIAPNKTKAGRAQNRRVVIKVLA